MSQDSKYNFFLQRGIFQQVLSFNHWIDIAKVLVKPQPEQTLIERGNGR